MAVVPMMNPRVDKEVDTTTATGRLPGLNIEIVHSRSQDGDSEQVSIILQAVPSFEAFGRSLEAANPFAIWAEAMRLAWLPWLEATRIMMLPASLAAPKPESKAVPHSSGERV